MARRSPRGDGISLIVHAADADAASAAERAGAEGVVLDANVGLKSGTRRGCRSSGASTLAEPRRSRQERTPCCSLAVSLEDDAEHVERRWQESRDIGLECVVEVRDADELELALEAASTRRSSCSRRRRQGDADDPLESVLDLLP